MIKKLNGNIKEIVAFIRGSNPAFLLFAEIFLGVILTMFSLFLFLKIRSEILANEFVNFDIQVLHSFYQYRSPTLDLWMNLITQFGGVYMVVLCVGLIVILAWKKHTREAVLLGFIISMGAVINALIKLYIQRPRPDFYPLFTLHDYSFPSGHAMNSFVFYVTIAYLVFHFTKNKRSTLAAIAVALVLILLIGVSRVYLGVHYPTDVLAGYLGGLCWFASVLGIEKTLIFFKLFRETKRANSRS